VDRNVCVLCFPFFVVSPAGTFVPRNVESVFGHRYLKQEVQTLASVAYKAEFWKVLQRL
jgi:hypothetical protein